MKPADYFLMFVLMMLVSLFTTFMTTTVVSQKIEEKFFQDLGVKCYRVAFDFSDDRLDGKAAIAIMCMDDVTEEIDGTQTSGLQAQVN